MCFLEVIYGRWTCFLGEGRAHRVPRGDRRRRFVCPVGVHRPYPANIVTHEPYPANIVTYMPQPIRDESPNEIYVFPSDNPVVRQDRARPNRRQVIVKPGSPSMTVEKMIPRKCVVIYRPWWKRVWMVSWSFSAPLTVVFVIFGVVVYVRCIFFIWPHLHYH